MFLLLALMPMSLYLSSSVSADSLNLALSFFTICLFLNLAFKDDKIHKKDIFFLSICILSLALSKQLYVLLALLFFIIPKSGFKNLKTRLIYFISTILPSGLILILLSHSFNNSISNITNSATLSSSSLFSNLVDFFYSIYDSIIVFFDGYLAEFVGYFGCMNIPLPQKLILIYICVIILVSVLSFRNKTKLILKQKLVCLLIFLGGSILIFKVAFDWSAQEFGLIFGVHGRYFIPLAPLLFLCLGSEKITFFNEKLFKYLNLFILLFIFLILSTSTYYLSIL